MWCVSGRSAGFPLGSQLCWAPILGELSFASFWALLTSINGRSASWASLAGKAQLRQKKLTSTMEGQLAGLPSKGSLSLYCSSRSSGSCTGANFLAII